jgi:hypothetical protein
MLIQLILLWHLITNISVNEKLNWKLVRDESSIQVYTAQANGDAFKHIYATAILPAPVSKVVDLVKNVNRYKEWGYYCQKSELLVAKPNEIIFYYVSDVPWPLSKRDLVSKMTIYDIGKEEVIIRSHQLNGYMPVQPKMVRIPESNAVWHFKALANGLTRATYTLQLNPGGNIPAWIVNPFIAIGPFETLKKLQDLCAGNGK